MKNKKIRQMFAMTLTGVMLCTLPVCAAEPAENTETAETAEMQNPEFGKDGNIRKKRKEPAKQDEETKEHGTGIYRLAQGEQSKSGEQELTSK